MRVESEIQRKRREISDNQNKEYRDIQSDFQVVQGQT